MVSEQLPQTKIAPPPPVKVRVWVRVSVEITVGGNFPWGNCPRTALDGSIMA